MTNLKEKFILVDAYNTLFIKNDKGENIINQELKDLLDSYSNRKIILTNATGEKQKEFGIKPVFGSENLFSLNANPRKTDGGYYEKMLDHYSLSSDDCIYFEHNLDAVNKAQEVGIKASHYENDLVRLQEFIIKNL